MSQAFLQLWGLLGLIYRRVHGGSVCLHVVNLVLGVSVGLEMMFMWVFKFCQEELRDVEDGFDDLQPSNARQEFFGSF